MFKAWYNLALWRFAPVSSADPALRTWLVQAARGSPKTRGVWTFVILLLWPVLFAVQAAIGAMIEHEQLWDTTPDSLSEAFEEMLTGTWTPYAIALSAATLATLELVCVRLTWLRLRARRVLLHRERCVHCGHGLTGLPLGETPQVVCPECGQATPAVEAWNEVAVDAQGRPIFRPADGLVRRFWTRRRVVLTSRIAGISAVITVLAYAGWWSIREMGIRAQAAIAVRERPGSEAINAMIQAKMPPAPVDQPIAFDLARVIASRYNNLAVAFEATHRHEASNTKRFEVDTLYLFGIRGSERTPEDEENRRFSLLFMSEVRDAGLFTLIDQLADASTWSPQSYRGPDDAPAPRGALSGLRIVSNLCAARMHLASDASDIEEFTRALRSGLCMARTASANPSVIGWLLGAANEALMLHEAAASMFRLRDATWVESIAGELAKASYTPPLAMIEIERNEMLDSLAWYFADPSRVRKGLEAAELRDKLGIGQFDMGMLFPDVEGTPHAPRLGTYTENRDGLNALMGWAKRSISMEPWQRRTVNDPRPKSDGLVIIDYWSSPYDHMIRNADMHLLRHRAVSAIIEIERYRLSHGEHPASLDLLPRDALTHGVRDPYSNKPFGYKRIDSATDDLGRHYLLWTVGLDGVDNGGTMRTSGDDSALREAGAGHDMVVNRPGW